jgi:guanosine-3',5'-bis(diphosphate) 3'-pyrophosphohydrolase
LEKAAATLRLDDVETLLARLGSAELTASELVESVYPNLAIRDGGEIDANRAVVGLEHGQGFERAACCQPLPGERIVGLAHRGRGVAVHAIDCTALADHEDKLDRWLDLRWADGKHPAVYTVSIEVTIGNDAGVLGRICTLIGETKANISDLNFLDRKPDFYRLMMDVDVRDAEHLHSLISILEAEANVASVERRRDPGLETVPAAAE